MILAFDTSGPWVATALLAGATLRATTHLEMAKGQGEHLLPQIEAMLSEADARLEQLTAIGVGTGPGNFTGIRISVAAARGLALGLRIPAIGISQFEALYGQRPRHGDALVVVPAPRGALYAQKIAPAPQAPQLIGTDDMPDALGKDPLDLIVAANIETIPDWMASRARALETGAALAPSIARLAGERVDAPQPRPAPLYIKPADAAPSRVAGPRLL